MNQGDTAFILISAALVLMMTPALAFFYGGLVRAKSVISMMMMSFGSMALVGAIWILYGYAVVFATPGNPGYVG
ncbi:MAG: ammonium transporter, partial [Microbacteriaceae bacterium]|nr:ammonium transporter [Microbacteriaceae bacterium]